MSQATRTSKYLVTWGKCLGNQWCPLNTVDLTHSAFSVGGCYIIWHGGQKPKVVYVGQGEFRQRLTAHRTDKRIQGYARHGLYVTYSPIAKSARDGVEVYLADRYKPLVGERHPDAPPIVVNGPWDR